MDNTDSFNDFLNLPKELNAAHRPLRLLLACAEGVSEDMLLPQRISGHEAICGGVEYRLQCVATDAGLPLKRFIAVPAALRIVTDRGQLRSVCGIIAEAAAGQSDGGLATYQLVLRDALALMEKRINTRVFRNKSELDILDILFTEWRLNNEVLASTFEYESLVHRRPPPREFIMQCNESDAAFLRRLLRRRGIAWYFRPGRPDGAPKATAAFFPRHTMVLFDDAMRLAENAAGTIRYHRDHAAEQRDTITAWNALRSLQAGGAALHSWDYGSPRSPGFMASKAVGGSDQGIHGNRFAAALNDYRVAAPHLGDSNDDLRQLGQLHMARLDYDTKCFQGEGGVRDLCVGEFFSLSQHPEIDRHPPAERSFVLTALNVAARSNLPKGLDARIDRLFSQSGWPQDAGVAPASADDRAMRYHNSFHCVRRGIAIVPAFDFASETPQPRVQSAIVVGPPGEEVHCDALGRIKVRFTATREADHRHADGAGASDTDADSAWLRVASPWAGNGPGGQQCGALTLPRVGSEVLIDFLGGDPDRPIVVGQLYNAVALPPALSDQGELPGNRYLSGLRSREIRGGRGNQLRFDDTQGQISAQLASEHAATQLNLGYLTAPRRDGDGLARGEGFELRSDAGGAIRTAKTLLISAWQRLHAAGPQLSGAESVALMSECLELFKSLGQYAAEHQGTPIDAAPAAELKTELAAALAGPAAGGGKPAVHVTAPAGLTLSTSKTILHYAGVNVDTVAQRHLQFTAGQRCIINAGAGVSLFAHNGGMAHIAHHGQFLIQSQHDKMQLDSAHDLTLTAGKRLKGMADDDITLMTSGGAYLRLSGGNVELGGPGPLTIKTNGHNWNGPASMKAELPSFTDGDLGRTPRLLSPLDERPVEGMALHLERDGGTADDDSGEDGRGAELVGDKLEQVTAHFFSKPT